MAQRRYWNKFDDDDTFELSTWFSGVMPPGRYAGFDAVLNAGLTLVINHATTGFSSVSEAKIFLPNDGIFVTTQGTLIKDDGTINLPINSTGASQFRIDLIVAEHEYIDVDDGEEATYSIVQGSPAASDPVAPAVPNPETQIIIGELRLPENCTDLNQVGVSFVQARTPNMGNSKRIAMRDEDNFFEGIQGWAINSNEGVVIDSGRAADFTKGSNSMVYDENFALTHAIVPDGLKEGAILTITATQDCSIQHDQNTHTGTSAQSGAKQAYFDIEGFIGVFTVNGVAPPAMRLKAGFSIVLLYTDDKLKILSHSNPDVMFNSVELNQFLTGGTGLNIGTIHEPVQVSKIGKWVHLSGVLDLENNTTGNIPMPAEYQPSNTKDFVIGYNTLEVFSVVVGATANLEFQRNVGAVGTTPKKLCLDGIKWLVD